jgi:hypothetical protein
MTGRITAFALAIAIGSGVLVGGAFAVPASAATEVAIGVVFAPYGPPAAPVEVIGVAPGPGYVWVGGHYAWRGRWVWVRGHWDRAPVGYAGWVPGHWGRRAGGWVWVEGHWR